MGTLISFIGAYINERRSVGAFTGQTPGVIRYRLHSFNKWFGDRALNRLSTSAVKKWLETIEHLSLATRGSYLSALRGFTKWLHDEHHIEADPCLKIAQPKRPRRAPRALSRDQVAACLKVCADDRERAIILLAVGCGLRRAEIAGVCWRDYDQGRGVLHIVGKGANERTVPVPSMVAAALAKLGGSADAPIIAPEIGKKIRPLSTRRVSELVERIMRDAGVKHAAYDGAGLHSFRHTAASDVLDACGDVTIVQRMLGHENLATTAVYLRSARLADVRSAMEGRDYEAEAEVLRIA